MHKENSFIMKKELQIRKIVENGKDTTKKYSYSTNTTYNKNGKIVPTRCSILSDRELYVGDFILARQKNHNTFIFVKFVSVSLHCMIEEIHKYGNFKTQFINIMSTYLITKVNTHNMNGGTFSEFVHQIKSNNRPKAMSENDLNKLKKKILDSNPIHCAIENLGLIELIDQPKYLELREWFIKELDDNKEFDAIKMITENQYEIIYYNDFKQKTITQHRSEFTKLVNYKNRLKIVQSIVGRDNFKLPLKIQISHVLNRCMKRSSSNWCLITEIKHETDLDVENIVKDHIDTFICFEDCITFKLNYENECQFETLLKQIKTKYVYDNCDDTYEGDSDTGDIMQTNAIQNAINEPVSIIFGQAGTGKTSVIKKIVDVEIGGRYELVLLAPTGKAVSRLKEVLSSGSKSKDITNVFTIHHITASKGSYVENEDGENNCFREPYQDRNGNYEDMPYIKPFFVILDEQSLQEFDILLEFLQVFYKHIGKILFVGDKNQIQPIGNGQVFKDLIDRSEYPNTELNTIFRTKHGVNNINQNARLVRSGDIRLEWSSSFVKHIISDVPDILKLFNSFDERPVILCDTNKDVCRINNILQHALLSENDINHVITRKTVFKDSCDINKVTKPLEFNLYKNWCYFLGETVMCVKNIYRIVDKRGFNNPNLIISNGTTGVIIDIGKESIIIKFGEYIQTFLLTTPKKPKNTKISNIIDRKCKTKNLICGMSEYIRPDYAITVDKSQGSEYNNVIYFCDDNFRNSREIIYTALTRAKRKLVIATYDISIISKCIQTKWKSKPSKLFKLDTHNHETCVQVDCRELKSERGVRKRRR